MANKLAKKFFVKDGKSLSAKGVDAVKPMKLPREAISTLSNVKPSAKDFIINQIIDFRSSAKSLFSIDMLKNYSRRSLWIRLPQYISLSLLEVILLFLMGKGGLIVKSYLTSYYWNLINLKDTLRERKKVIRRVKDKDLPFSKTIGKIYALQNKLVKWT